jgi:polygalacturonase
VKRKQWLVGGCAVVASVLGSSGCYGNPPVPPSPSPVCESSPAALWAKTSSGGSVCGAGDPNLPPEPTLPTIVCQTLSSNNSTPDESNLDTAAIQTALDACAGQGAVKLTSRGANHVFVSGNLRINSTILWIDAGTTLFASRDPSQYQSTGNCGLTGISDSSACLPLLSATGTNPGVVGDGVIDGQGGEPLVGQDYSWWDLSNALRASNGSGPNPALIEVRKATGFLMYRITLHNSPKFHVKLSAVTPDPNGCVTPGSGFTIWGITILTPSVATTSTGFRPTPFYSRNTDGIDPGQFALTNCGVIACNTISTGDDQVALKGAHGLHDVVVAHNHFGTGHGMSLGSETNGGVSNVNVYDLTIDADSRWSGAPASDTADFNGLRVKSDESRGGQVDNITFTDVCMRDMLNPIVIDSSYNPLYGGTVYPDFHAITMKNIRQVGCKALAPPNVILQGFNDQHPAGPITLDNVVLDGITPLYVYGQYSSVTLGPGNVNFIPSGTHVFVTNGIVGGAAPKPCSFPPLPVEQ